MNQTWIDVSVPLRTGLVHWPDDPEPTFELISDIEHGAEANVTLCRMTAHTGTHMDAPCHFLPGKMPGIDRFPLEAGIGLARVISLSDGCDVISRTELEHQDLKRGERVLLKTRNSRRQWATEDFDTGYVGLNLSAATFLANAGVVLIGVDYLSIGVFKGDGAAAHRALLSAGVWIVEGLDLNGVPEGSYELVCLPLRIAGADGAPARVALRRL